MESLKIQSTPPQIQKGWDRAGYHIKGEHFEREGDFYLSLEAQDNFGIIQTVCPKLQFFGSLFCNAFNTAAKHNYQSGACFMADHGVDLGTTVEEVNGMPYKEMSRSSINAGLDIIVNIADNLQTGKGSEEERAYWGEHLQHFVTNIPNWRDRARLTRRAIQNISTPVTEELIIR